MRNVDVLVPCIYTVNGDNFNLDDRHSRNKRKTVEMSRPPSKRNRWTLIVDDWTQRT